MDNKRRKGKGQEREEKIEDNKSRRRKNSKRCKEKEQ